MKVSPSLSIGVRGARARAGRPGTVWVAGGGSTARAKRSKSILASNTMTGVKAAEEQEGGLLTE